MDQVLTFLGQLEEVIAKIFELVDFIMGKVDEYTAKDAE